MKALTLLTTLLHTALTTANPTPGDLSLTPRCTLSCAVGHELYLNPGTGACSCVAIKGCTELCVLNLTYYTNPATGVCSCVPKCNTATPDSCGAGYNCVPQSSSCDPSVAAGCPGACVAIHACTLDCIIGLRQWTDPRTGLCTCVHPCGAASSAACPTGFSCSGGVCLAHSCQSC